MRAEKKAPPTGSGAHLVAAGILLSRVSGLVRQRVFAYYFGNSDAGDAFYAAFKIPNFLQNLFGEGVLSASFIPVYAGLLGRDAEEEADEVARAVGSLLFLLTSILVLVGVATTPYLIDLIAPGFHGEKRELTIRLVQIFFPGTGLLVLSAWCLGILNSHRKFFLSYAAPVASNAAVIAALVWYGKSSSQSELAVYTSWGSVVGSALQFGVQLPVTLRFLKRATPTFATRLESVRTVLRNFVPVVIARGVVQVSAYVDNILASFLPTGAVSALAYAQSLYMLPISLFGMSVSAAELPAMSKAHGSAEEVAVFLRSRVDSGLRQIAFFIVPSMVGFLALGDVIVAALYQSGEFGRESSLYVWGVLAGSTVGLLATTLGRLYSSTFYSLKNTRTPLYYATIRVCLTTALGYLCGLRLPGWLGISEAWGTAGLTASAGIAGWIEFLLLRGGVNRRIGHTGLSLAYVAKLWASAGFAALAGWGAKLAIARVVHHLHPIPLATVVLGIYGVLYFALTSAFGVEASRRFLRRIFR